MRPFFGQVLVFVPALPSRGFFTQTVEKDVSKPIAHPTNYLISLNILTQAQFLGILDLCTVNMRRRCPVPAARPLRYSRVPAPPGLLHIFCGKDCEQGT
jgi:hypothetical protein